MRDIRIGKLFMGAINKDLRSDIENNNIYGCTLVTLSICVRLHLKYQNFNLN